MRAVVDTNVLISGLLWRGAPHTLIGAGPGGRFVLLSSSMLLAELERVLRRRKFRAILTRSEIVPNRILREVALLAEMASAPPLRAPVSRDPDDDHVLAVAVAARADLIVSGDQDLLSLGFYENIRIVDPALAVRLIAAS